ncbi:MAG: hypothetical protein A2475_11660 [Ignavibacteria bacterium RIFOXYC2_FULL_35_21]|nr:MAG: hypothetical protein A2X63_11665 [Ignavibacteria bacterium GWA2_35_8]OGU95462.1 MAG: hypothetical protein A2220_07065 [Ignavibacteria bacterium RIFOXYA2_FULL_35_10]OGV20822.1 MAG: hypothetical protein A2475_11660 [Ignavibacteria bacterium RIFOXYC2_FULL_35_21]
MSKIKIIYAVTSILFLLLLAVSPLKEIFKDWRNFQNSFNSYTDSFPFKVAKVDNGLKQIWNKNLGIIDRCITCHVGLNENKLSNAPQPFTSHPKIYHDNEKYGCTVCHDGQGLSTKYEDAHLPTEFWDKPLLPRKYIESACYRCHDDLSDKFTPLHNKGKELIEKYNCVSCHDLPGIPKQYTPDLNGVGTKIKNKQWLIDWLKNPSLYATNARMPNFKLSETEVTILSDFLFSFKERRNSQSLYPLPEYYNTLKKDEDFIKLGKVSFSEARCISCHSIEGKGGKLAIDLIKVASKASEKWIYSCIKNPKAIMPGVEMTQFGFSDKEAAAITAYIESEFVDWNINEDEIQNIKPVTGYYEKGIEIYNKYNCGGCHKLDIKEIKENKGPELTTISNKKLYQIEWGKSNLKHSLYEYLENKLETPRAFGENTRMPEYKFYKEEITAITAYLLAQRNNEVPQNYLVRKNKVQPFKPQGVIGKTFEKYSCLKCHSVNDYGGKIAPDLAKVGSQLNRDWIRKYFNIPYSLRAIVEERMPKLFISTEEVEMLLDYFESVFIDDNLDFKLNLTEKPEELEKGKMLFKEKYGCQSCHIIDGSGGYVGPPLDNVGERLKPTWIYSWIKNPQKYKANTIDPKTGMNEEDLLLITSYLFHKRSW